MRQRVAATTAGDEANAVGGLDLGSLSHLMSLFQFLPQVVAVAWRWWWRTTGGVRLVVIVVAALSDESVTDGQTMAGVQSVKLRLRAGQQPDLLDFLFCYSHTFFCCVLRMHMSMSFFVCPTDGR